MKSLQSIGRRPQEDRRSGFTLLEVVIAATIFAFVMTAIYVVFDSGRRLTSTGEYHAGIYQTGRAALREIERDLRAAYSSGSAYDTGLIGEDGGDEEVPLDEVTVLGINNHLAIEIPEGEDEKYVEIDLTRVTYRIDDEKGLVRRRVRALNIQTQMVDEDEDEEIAKNIIGLNIEYYDGDWKTTWNSTQTNTLPQAIRVTIVVRGERRGEEDLTEFTTKFHLPLWEFVPQVEEEGGGSGR